VVERAGEPEFGTMVSASGRAFTWAGNSRENRLTPFANDPVSDPTGEAIYLRDEDVGRGLGRHAGSAAAAAGRGRWVVGTPRASRGIQHAIAGLDQELTCSSRRTIRSRSRC
jgi:cyclic beta-1,2-glucan synthetase